MKIVFKKTEMEKMLEVTQSILAVVEKAGFSEEAKGVREQLPLTVEQLVESYNKAGELSGLDISNIMVITYNGEEFSIEYDEELVDDVMDACISLFDRIGDFIKSRKMHLIMAVGPVVKILKSAVARTMAKLEKELEPFRRDFVNLFEGYREEVLETLEDKWTERLNTNPSDGDDAVDETAVSEEK